MFKWIIFFGIVSIVILLMFLVLGVGILKTDDDKANDDKEQLEYIKKWKEKHKENK